MTDTRKTYSVDPLIGLHVPNPLDKNYVGTYSPMPPYKVTPRPSKETTGSEPSSEPKESGGSARAESEA